MDLLNSYLNFKFTIKNSFLIFQCKSLFFYIYPTTHLYRINIQFIISYYTLNFSIKHTFFYWCIFKFLGINRQKVI